MSENFGVRYKTARERALDLLEDCEWHENAEFVEQCGVRYSARILELERLGYQIEKQAAHSGHGKRYRLKSLALGAPKQKLVKVYVSEDDAARFVDGYVPVGLIDAVEDALGSFRHNREKL